MDAEGWTPAEGAGPGSALRGDPNTERRPRSWLTYVGLGLGTLVAIGVIAGFVIRVPYTTISPGDAKPLAPLVKIEGAKVYPPSGDIRLLFVREAYHVNFWQYVRARLDDNIDLVKDGAVNPGQLTPHQQNDLGLQQMRDAKGFATAVALRAAGYKVRVEPGIVVSDLVPGDPAIKQLYWGDIILTVDGRRTNVAKDLTAALSKHHPGDEISLGIVRGGKHMTVKSGVILFHGRPIIGVLVSPHFGSSVKVGVDTTEIGGPSAGLAMSLAIFDDLTPGSLTGGRNVAVTGTIDPSGNVGEIGGIAQKAISARAKHVTLFIVPQCSPDDSPDALAACKADLARASQRAGSKIKVVPVATFDEALAALRDNGGDPVPATGAVSSTTIAA
jgi:PDZ domain-containing protein